MDRAWGVGHDVQVPGTMTRRFTREPKNRTDRAFLDSRSGGYGWAEVADVEESAYATTVAAQWTKP